MAWREKTRIALYERKKKKPAIFFFFQTKMERQKGSRCSYVYEKENHRVLYYRLHLFDLKVHFFEDVTQYVPI